MEFLKKFFNDDNTVIGLCKFERIRPKYYQTPATEAVFFNSFESKCIYKTNVEKNILLSR